MLKTRVITACCLFLGLVLGLLALPYSGLVVFFSVIFLLAAGEWANISGLAQRWQQGVYAGVMACVMYLLFLFGAHRAGVLLNIVLLLSLLGWLFVFIVVRSYPTKKISNHASWLLLLGFWLLIPAWLGVLFLQPLVAYSGLLWLVIAVIAFADIGAYFSGRRFGRRKLAVHVSPNKTWEGFWGGTLANAVFALVLALIVQCSAWQTLGLVVAVVLVSCVSVLGDLFESMMKRERGIKDSSNLLPGHGGVLDRLDGWTAAVPMFTALYIVWSALQ
ncbi:MAG: phosphatidate cytidylyltransferase [Pseudomonadales bacterium]